MGDMPKEVTITKLSSHTGAEVQGVDLTRPLQPAETPGGVGSSGMRLALFL